MKTIRIGQISLSFHRASAAYITNLMEMQGYKVEIKEASHEAAFELLANGEIDMLISAWLPGSHGKYLEPIADQTLQLGVIYEPYCIWGVPDYSNPSLLAVSDLNREEIAEDVEKMIYSINPGAGISRFSIEIMEKYNLAQSGFRLKNVSENEFFKRIELNLAERKQFIIPFWQPQSLHFQYSFRELLEPFGLLRSKDQATVIMRAEFYDTVDAITIQLLKSVYLGNQKISAMDYFLHTKGLNVGAALIASGIDNTSKNH